MLSDLLLTRNLHPLMSLATILETYTLSEILELNDLTEEDVLEYLVEQGWLHLPRIRPLEFQP